MLFRLLHELRSDRYCVISQGDYNTVEHDVGDPQRLPARHHHIRPAFQLPVPNDSVLFAFNIILNALLGIYDRAKQITRIARQEGCGLLVACTGDFYDLPAAYVASKWMSIPLITYIFDDYAYQWIGFKRFISKGLESVVLPHARAVIVTNEYMQKEYERRYGIRSHVIHNPCSLPDLDELDKAGRVFSQERINIVYTGAVYHAHYDAFRNLVAAIQLTGREDIILHIYTDQPVTLLEQQGIRGHRVSYHQHVRQSEVPGLLRQADILFLPLAFDSPIPEVVKTSAPGKTGEYLSAGRPILVHAPEDSFICWYFKEHHCGVVADENDPLSLCRELRKIMDDEDLRRQLNENARKAAEEDFSSDMIRNKFMDVLEMKEK